MKPQLFSLCLYLPLFLFSLILMSSFCLSFLSFSFLHFPRLHLLRITPPTFLPPTCNFSFSSSLVRVSSSFFRSSSHSISRLLLQLLPLLLNSYDFSYSSLFLFALPYLLPLLSPHIRLASFQQGSPITPALIFHK